MPAQNWYYNRFLFMESNRAGVRKVLLILGGAAYLSSTTRAEAP